jgi:tetratricopeptide (TPR) repeat protein
LLIHANISQWCDRMTRAATRIARFAALIVSVSALAAPIHATGDAVAPLLDGMGRDRGPVASRVPLAQRYFHQGMTLTWGFNPAEAARSFEAATRADPGCALCWWGLAWAQGPNINSDMDPAAAMQVSSALVEARALSPRSPPRTRALIEALAVRHRAADPAQSPDEQAYATRMQGLSREYPNDADIATLAAEAMLNLHPYDWWDAKGGARPWTSGTIVLLNRALTLAPEHPGANHYLIHLMESSPHPERALASANRLRNAIPGSGHLLHMPAHVYMRIGRYADAVTANEKSIAADKRYLEQVDAQRAYRVGYVAHNQHFLWAAAAMEGRSAEAIAAARAAWPAACGLRPGDRSTGILQHYYVLPLYALVRFGRWQEILEDTLPPDVAEPYAQAIWHYARGTAFARTGRVEQARHELADIERGAADPALERARIKNINPARTLVKIAALTLTADIAAAEGRPVDAVAPLVEATSLEDALTYDEPHLWLAPTRHALGAALLAAGRPAEAEKVYLEDLRHYPENGWSLQGLAEAQRRQGAAAAANATQSRARAAWVNADIPLTASRI